jgi:hypothetical protein
MVSTADENLPCCEVLGTQTDAIKRGRERRKTEVTNEEDNNDDVLRKAKSSQCYFFSSNFYCTIQN